MQFKHPELLYALLLLIIPIIVHLFQLRKFRNVPFTNVRFLQELTIQTRKSAQLKKWLTLLTRMLLLACAVIAFAQPYISKSDSFNTQSEIVIYLDNSFSMQAPSTNGSLLNSTVQELIENLNDEEKISIFTNNNTYRNTSIKAIKNDLIQLQYSPFQLNYKAAILKGKQLFSDDANSIKNFILISDFQQQNEAFTVAEDSLIDLKLVKLEPTNTNNVALDSVYISKSTVENLEITVQLKNQGAPIEILPISLYNDDKLIAKSAVDIVDTAIVNFTIPANAMFNGKIVVEDRNLQYDNVLFFNIDRRDKIKVLSINSVTDDFLKRVYTKDEFVYSSSQFNALNYNSIDDQNLIILNELNDLPSSLITALEAFTNDGGSLLIIPPSNANKNSYNQLFINYNLSRFDTEIPNEKKITAINFSHPLLANVFDKRVANFQYPKVANYYTNITPSVRSILDFEDGSSFLAQSENVYRFSAALNSENSNFKNSPLIVPILYNIGRQSLKTGDLYYTIGITNTIDIATQLQQDDILTLVNDGNSVIPLQQTFSNRVELTTDDFPYEAGIISVKNKETLLKYLSFNFDRHESALNYLDLDGLDNVTTDNSLSNTITTIKSATNVNELWKWFVIFAVVFLIIEMLILKFLK